MCLYSKEVKVWYKTVDALWYSSAGQKLLRIIVVHDPAHRRRDDCFFSTDRELTPPEILTKFSLRWPLEVCFRDVKQFLGFEDPQQHASRAVRRTAPLAGLVYDLVLLSYAAQVRDGRGSGWPVRPWYPAKTAPSFLDMLAAARHASLPLAISTPPSAPCRLNKPACQWPPALPTAA